LLPKHVAKHAKSLVYQQYQQGAYWAIDSIASVQELKQQEAL
jgi:hypothetical protein